MSKNHGIKKIAQLYNFYFFFFFFSIYSYNISLKND